MTKTAKTTRCTLLLATLALASLLWTATLAADAASDRTYFTDTVLVNQDGQEMRFYSDLLAGKVVVIDTFFTSCQGVCPVLIKNFLSLQQSLGDRLGKDVVLISLSVDPETDTPAKLEEFADGIGARKGWYFLAGEKANLDVVLRKLGAWVEHKEGHSPVVLVGNLRTGLWKKAMGMAPADQFVGIVSSVIEDQGPTAAVDSATVEPAAKAGR